MNCVWKDSFKTKTKTETETQPSNITVTYTIGHINVYIVWKIYRAQKFCRMIIKIIKYGLKYYNSLAILTVKLRSVWICSLISISNEYVMWYSKSWRCKCVQINRSKQSTWNFMTTNCMWCMKIKRFFYLQTL